MSPSRLVQSLERTPTVATELVIDHFYPCPTCGHVLITMATRPWKQWCRTCKTHVSPPNQLG